MNLLLDQNQIEEKLKDLDLEWSVVSGILLSRVYNFEDFDKALKFVNKVGKIADEANHHPDIELSWGKVVVNITSHSAGGLTGADFELAAKI